jgi:hypothetical protein
MNFALPPASQGNPTNALTLALCLQPDPCRTAKPAETLAKAEKRENTDPFVCIYLRIATLCNPFLLTTLTKTPGIYPRLRADAPIRRQKQSRLKPQDHANEIFLDDVFWAREGEGRKKGVAPASSAPPPAETPAVWNVTAARTPSRRCGHWAAKLRALVPRACRSSRVRS